MDDLIQRLQETLQQFTNFYLKEVELKLEGDEE